MEVSYETSSIHFNSIALLSLKFASTSILFILVIQKSEPDKTRDPFIEVHTGSQYLIQSMKSASRASPENLMSASLRALEQPKYPENTQFLLYNVYHVKGLYQAWDLH